MPGDFARIEEDGKVTLLGRGSNCVNTGGEKVYPEEVEMAIKAHPAVYDCLVVGIPDEKYGQAVAAVVAAARGRRRSSSRSCATFLRDHLSGYKLPRSLTVVDEIPRNATGKAQYPAKARWRSPRSMALMRTPLCDAVRDRLPDLRVHPVRARRGRGLAAPAAWACSAACGSTTPRSSSGS